MLLAAEIRVPGGTQVDSALRAGTTVLVRCTQKLLRLLRKKPEEVGDTPKGVLTEWYANLLWIERRKCILFTDSASLYSFLVADIRKSDLGDFRSFLGRYLAASLVNHGIQPRAVPSLSSDDDLRLARTRDRVVLGCMTEIAFHYKWHIASEGGLATADLLIIERKINEMPMSPLEHVTPLNTLSRQISDLPRASLIDPPS